MPNNLGITSKSTGTLHIAYSNASGSTVGVTFSDATEAHATAIIMASTTVVGHYNAELKTLTKKSGKAASGGDSMEQRLAVLEAEMAHLKSDVSDLKKLTSSIESTVNSVDKNIAIVMVKLDSIDDSLSKKPSSDAVDKKIAEAKVSQIIWTIASVLAIVSIASGIVIKVLHA
ncbi:TPA: hypothetical protein ACHOZE_004408 [Raoultella ornithinolytica]